MVDSYKINRGNNNSILSAKRVGNSMVNENTIVNQSLEAKCNINESTNVFSYFFVKAVSNKA